MWFPRIELLLLAALAALTAASPQFTQYKRPDDSRADVKDENPIIFVDTVVKHSKERNISVQTQYQKQPTPETYQPQRQPTPETYQPQRQPTPEAYQPQRQPASETYQPQRQPAPETYQPQRQPTPIIYQQTDTQQFSTEDKRYEDPQPEKVKYYGSQVWNIVIDNPSKLTVVSGLSRSQEVASWGGDHNAVDFMVRPEKQSNVANILRRSNITYSVVIEDLQRNIDTENPPLSEQDQDLQDRKARAYSFWHSYRTKGHVAMPVMKPANRKMAALGAYMGYNSLDGRMEYWPTANWGHRMTWQQYHRLGDIHGFLDYLAVTYPNLCSVMTIGKSYQGRDLKMLRISNGQANNKAVLIDGGIHAREWISPATVTYIINEFAENFEAESNAIRNMDWYFIPVLNPDGYEYTHTVDRLWRKNRRGFGPCSGTDLNRNFGYKWGGQGTSKNPCSEVYPGQHAFSEPESKALSDFVMRSSAKFKLYATYHSYGEYILYPWGYDKVVPEDYLDLDRVGNDAAQAIIQAGGAKYRVGASSIVLYPAAGGSDDWAKAIAGIKYTYTVELSDRGRYGFVLPASYIAKVAKESLAALRVMAESANLV